MTFCEISPQKILLLICLVFTIIGCDKDSLTPVIIRDIPVNIGTTWHYSQEKRIQRFEVGSNGDLIIDTTLTGSSVTRVVKDTVLNDTQSVWVFENKNTLATGGLFGSTDFSISFTYNYMYKDAEGLKMYAYRFSDCQLYPQSMSVNPHGIAQKKITIGDIIVESHPTLYVQLPLNEQSAWSYRKSNSFQGQINKKVSGYEFLEVDSKHYFCYKVVWEYLNNDAYDGLTTTEWFSDIGMVKTEIHHERQLLTNHEGEALGEIQMTEVILLEDYQAN